MSRIAQHQTGGKPNAGGTASQSDATLSNVSLAERAYRIRRNALRMGEVQGQGYIAQALGIADVLAVSYFHALSYRPDDPEWEGRDRFLLSIGHYAIALYAALIEAGILPEDELETYGSDDSRLPMSGMAAYTPGMEITGGSLGHGLGIAVGIGLGAQAQEVEPRSSTTCSPTASSTRARPGRRRCRPAAIKLDNLIGIVDVNNQQADGPSTEDPELRAARRRSSRPSAGTSQRVDGNDIEALVAAFDAARRLTEPKPRIIICDTRMGKGVPFLEERERNHFLRVEQDEWQKALRDPRRREAVMSARNMSARPPRGAGRRRPEGRLAAHDLGDDRLARRPPASARGRRRSATRSPRSPRRGPTSSA